MTAGSGGGLVVSAPAGIDCARPLVAPSTDCSEVYQGGTDVVLAAEPAGGSFFGGFSSNCTPVAGLPQNCTVRMDAANTVTASFVSTSQAQAALGQAAQSSAETQALAEEIRTALAAALARARAKVQSEADALREARAELDKAGVEIAKRALDKAIAARNAALVTIRATQRAMVSASNLKLLLETAAADPTPEARAAVAAQIPTFRDDFRKAAAQAGVKAITDKLPSKISLLLSVFAPNIQELGEQTLQEVLEAGFELALGNPERLVALVNKARTTVDDLGKRFDAKFQQFSPEDRKGFGGAMRLIYTGLDLESEILYDAIAAGVDQNRQKLTALYAQATDVSQQLKNKIQGAVTAAINDDLTKQLIKRTEAAVADAVAESKSIANKIANAF